jgi:hypothetical protein
MTIRRIAKVFKSRPTVEGAGMHLKRAFGYSNVPQFDPFLMLDDFHTCNPDECHLSLGDTPSCLQNSGQQWQTGGPIIPFHPAFSSEVQKPVVHSCCDYFRN